MSTPEVINLKLDFSDYQFESRGGMEPPYHAEVMLVGSDGQEVEVANGFSSWVPALLEASRLNAIKTKSIIKNGQEG